MPILFNRKKLRSFKSVPPGPNQEAYAEVGRNVVASEMPTQALADRAVEPIPETESQREWVANRQSKFRGVKIPD